MYFTCFQAERHNRLVLTGRCKSVGAGGFIAGGGIGLFSIALGLGVDNVLEIKVFFDVSLTVKAAPHECVIRTFLP